MANVEPKADAARSPDTGPKPDEGACPPAGSASPAPPITPDEPTDTSPTVISKDRRKAHEPPSQAAPGNEQRAVTAAKKVTEWIRGCRLGHFELEETLGVGGMAAVLRARDTLLDRRVALKVLPPEMANDPENVRRFENEAKAAARLDHENIARVFFCGEDQGLHFIAFEYVEGVNLRVLIEKRGHLSVPEAIHYTLQIATGLVHAAERGVIHRDIKPSNIIVTADGRAKLVDMGLARNQARLTGEGLTHSGMTLGTFDYISPEQALEPRDADVRSDIYSLGCTLYHLLTGQPPVPEGTAARKLQFHQNEPPIDPRQINAEIPDEVAAIVARMIAKDPNDRYQRPEDLVPHLLAVAQRLSGQAPSPPGNGVYLVDAILPSPPRIRPLAVLVTASLAVAVLVGALAVLGELTPDRGKSRSALTDRRSPNGEHAGQGGLQPNAATQAPSGSELPALDTTVDIRSARELRDWVARGGAGVAQLDNLNYDFTDDDAAPEHFTGLVCSTGELVIQAKNGAKPIIRLTGRGGAGLATERPALFVNGANVTVRGVRFVLDPETGSAPLTALAVSAGQLQLIDCEFVQREASGASGLTVLKVLARGGAPAVDMGRAHLPQIEFQNCTFGGGQNGILLQDAAKVTLSQCRFAPYLLPIQLVDRFADGRGAAISLRECTCLLWPRPFLEATSSDPCTFSMERSIFSVSDETLHASQPTLLLLGRDQDRERIQFQGAGNYYQNLPVLIGQTTETDMAQELVREIPDFGRFAAWRDFGSQKGSESPWQDRVGDPNFVDPWRAVKEGKSLADLRLRPGWHGTPPVAASPSPSTPSPAANSKGATAAAPLSPGPDNPPTEVVVDGKGLVAGTYRNLATALTDTQGDIVITLKIGGRLECAALDILGARRVHIRAAAPFRPELTLNPDAVPGAGGETALFHLHDGDLILEGLAFRLQPTLKEAPKIQAVLSITGVGHAKLKDCLATLAGDGSPRMAVAAIADPTGSMMGASGKPPRPGTPAVEVEDCFVRGNGDMVTIRVSRPYRLEVRSALVVLGGSLLSEEGNKSEATMSSEGASISLDRVTAVVTQNLIVLRTTLANPVHVPLHIAPATTCLFAAAEGGPLVSIDGPQSESELKRWLTWSGRRNLYSTSGSLLVWQPLEKADMPHKYDSGRWNDLWGRDDDEPRFARDLKFAGYPAPLKNRADLSPDDLRIVASEGPDKEMLGRGVDLDKLPKPPPADTAQPE